MLTCGLALSDTDCGNTSVGIPMAITAEGSGSTPGAAILAANVEVEAQQGAGANAAGLACAKLQCGDEFPYNCFENYKSSGSFDMTVTESGGVYTATITMSGSYKVVCTRCPSIDPVPMPG